LCVMPRKGEVLLYDQPVHLTKHEFNLLYHFMQHPNIVFSREQLVNELYPSEEKIVLERTIDAHIKKLREKIEQNPSTPKRIQTVRGMGYKLVTVYTHTSKMTAVASVIIDYHSDYHHDYNQWLGNL